MTIAEIDRAAASYQRRFISNAKEKATFDYVLAQLIGFSVSRAVNGGDNDFPAIEEIYPTLFKERAKATSEAKQEAIETAFAIHLKQFAKQHNNKLEKRGLVNKE